MIQVEIFKHFKKLTPTFEKIYVWTHVFIFLSDVDELPFFHYCQNKRLNCKEFSNKKKKKKKKKKETQKQRSFLSKPELDRNSRNQNVINVDQFGHAPESRWSRGPVSASRSTATNGESCVPHPAFSGHGSDVTHSGPSRTRGFHALISYATCRLCRPPESYSVRFSPVTVPATPRKRSSSRIIARGKTAPRGEREGERERERETNTAASRHFESHVLLLLLLLLLRPIPLKIQNFTAVAHFPSLPKRSVH